MGFFVTRTETNYFKFISAFRTPLVLLCQIQIKYSPNCIASLPHSCRLYCVRIAFLLKSSASQISEDVTEVFRQAIVFIANRFGTLIGLIILHKIHIKQFVPRKSPFVSTESVGFVFSRAVSAL